MKTKMMKTVVVSAMMAALCGTAAFAQDNQPPQWLQGQEQSQQQGPQQGQRPQGQPPQQGQQQQGQQQQGQQQWNRGPQQQQQQQQQWNRGPQNQQQWSKETKAKKEINKDQWNKERQAPKQIKKDRKDFNKNMKQIRKGNQRPQYQPKPDQQ